METSDWVALAVGAVTLGGIIIALIMSSRLRTATVLAAANMVESWHKAEIARKRGRLAELAIDAHKNANEIKIVETELTAKRRRLERKYVSKNLTSEQIAERFRRIGM